MAVRNGENIEEIRIVLGLLESVQRDKTQTNRRLASDLGIALGLANAYLRRCVKKGFIKVKRTPASRYAYFVTPKGFSEKSRLTARYLTHAFSFFRQARNECGQQLREAERRGWKQVALAGQSDLAEIAMICAREYHVEISAIVDRNGGSFFGIPVRTGFDGLDTIVDALMVTDLQRPQNIYENARTVFGNDRILLPKLLKIIRDAEAPASS